MDIIKHRKLYFIFSGCLVFVSIVLALLFGLKQSIDFTGGSRINLKLENPDKTKIEKISREENLQNVSISIKEDGVLIRTNTLEEEQKNNYVEKIKEVYPEAVEESFETVGPTIGQETRANAARALIVASIAITLYVAFAFRRVSKPVSSWKYGVTAIITLFHDVIIVVGTFSLLGLLLNVEVDSLFITALLTVMGFSVHDTIVVFDRIRESLRRNQDMRFELVINNALLETMNRSVNTSITVIIVLFSLLLFGGESIRWFVVALIVGVIVGTYSSIFTASPLLVVWKELDKKRIKVQG